MKLQFAKADNSLYLVDASSTETELKKAMLFVDIPTYLKARVTGELKTITVPSASFTPLDEMTKITLAHEQDLFKLAAKQAEAILICQTYDRLRCPK